MSAKYREIRFLNIIQIPRVRSHSVRSFCPVYKEYTYFYQYLMVLILSLSGVHYHGRGGVGKVCSWSWARWYGWCCILQKNSIITNYTKYRKFKFLSLYRVLGSGLTHIVIWYIITWSYSLVVVTKKLNFKHKSDLMWPLMTLKVKLHIMTNLLLYMLSCIQFFKKIRF